jgi:hypothetical protein
VSWCAAARQAVAGDGGGVTSAVAARSGAAAEQRENLRAAAAEARSEGCAHHELACVPVLGQLAPGLGLVDVHAKSVHLDGPLAAHARS